MEVLGATVAPNRHKGRSSIDEDSLDIRRIAGLVLGVVLAAACNAPTTRTGRTELQVSPGVIEAGVVAVGASQRAELTLSNAGRVPFRVVEVTSSDPVLSVSFEPFELAAGASGSVALIFTPQTSGPFRGELAVTIDDGSEPHIVPFAGEATVAQAAIDVASIDFGRVALGTAQPRPLTISNPSLLEVQVELTLPADAPFSAKEPDPNALTLRPGERRDLSLIFTPAALGSAEAIAQVRPCTGCAPIEVALTGVGIIDEVDIFPTVIDFGVVTRGATATQTVAIQNLGTEPIRLRGARIIDGVDGAFEVVPGQLLPIDIAPKQIRSVAVRFTPAHDGPALGVSGGPRLELDLQTATITSPPRLPLFGEGGPSCLVVLPREVDFDQVSEGHQGFRRVTVINRCDEALELLESSTTATHGGFFSVVTSLAGQTLAAHEERTVELAYSPKPATGQSTGVWTLRAQHGQSVSTQEVPLRGTRASFAPCEVAASSGALDFGVLALGEEAALGVTLTNIGDDTCFVESSRMVSGSDPAFSTVWAPSQTLAPGASMTRLVRFAPKTAGSSTGQLDVWVNHPTHPRIPVALSGEGVQSCVVVEPTHVFFGAAKVGCSARTATIRARNECTASAPVSSVTIEGAAQSSFSVAGNPNLPLMVAAGQSVDFDVTWAPLHEGHHSAALRISAEGHRRTVGLEGLADSVAERKERLRQEVRPKVDVLFVIDNSSSMSDEQSRLAEHLADFLEAATRHQVDYQIGVTTTGLTPHSGITHPCPGGAAGGEAGRLFPANGTSPRIIQPSTPNAEKVFANNVQVGTCHFIEQGLEAAYLALSAPLIDSVDATGTSLEDDGNAGFLRPDAKLAIIFVTDEEDFSPRPLATYETFFRSLKSDPTKLSVSAVVGPTTPGACPTASSPGSRYISLAGALGGVVENICDPDWQGMLQKIGAGAFAPKRAFRLDQAPQDPALIEVEVDGVPITSGWSFDAATNSVIFDAGHAHIPPPGAVIDIRYPVGCVSP